MDFREWDVLNWINGSSVVICDDSVYSKEENWGVVDYCSWEGNEIEKLRYLKEF